MTRDEQRAANRARFPEFAAMTDSGRWKLLHAQDAQGELGKLPDDDPAWVTQDWSKPSLYEYACEMAKGRRR